MVERRYRTCNLCEAMCGLADDDRRRARDRRAGRRRGPVLARPHLPEGPGDARSARGPGPPAPPRAADGVGVGAGLVGRGDRRGGRPHRRGAGEVWPARGRRVLRQPERPQPRRPHDGAGPALGAAHAEQVRRQFPGREPQDLRRAAHVRRPPRADPARRRSHRVLPRLRREPRGVEREHHDARRRARPAQGHPRARRAGGAGRSAAHRDGVPGPTSTTSSARGETRRSRSRCSR